MANTPNDDGLAEPDPSDLDAERYELMLEAQALAHTIEGLIESGDDQVTNPGDPANLKQRQYACLRALRMHLAEVGALSDAIERAKDGGNGASHG